MSKKTIVGIASGIAAAAVGVTAIVLAIRAASIGMTPARASEVSAALLGALVTVAISIAALYIRRSAGHTIHEASDGTTFDDGSGPALAVNITAFLTFGIAGIVAATSHWPLILFWAIAFMLGGGFLGLLFGIPIGVPHASTKAQGQADNGNDNPKRQTTLLVEAANTVGKVLGGAIAFSFKNIYGEFHDFTTSLGQSMGEPNGNLPGGILIFFGAFGFLCGVLLPRYFLKQLMRSNQ